MRKQFYQTALWKCCGLKLPKCWLQFKKKVYCHVLSFSAHFRSLLAIVSWTFNLVNVAANCRWISCVACVETGCWVALERHVCVSWQVVLRLWAAFSCSSCDKDSLSSAQHLVLLSEYPLGQAVYTWTSSLYFNIAQYPAVSLMKWSLYTCRPLHCCT